MTDNVSLVRFEGPTSIYVEASIDADGDLVLSGQDVGEAPLEKFYSGDASVVSELREYLEAKGIPAEFSSY